MVNRTAHKTTLFPRQTQTLVVRRFVYKNLVLSFPPAVPVPPLTLIFIFYYFFFTFWNLFSSFLTHHLLSAPSSSPLYSTPDVPQGVITVIRKTAFSERWSISVKSCQCVFTHVVIKHQEKKNCILEWVWNRKENGREVKCSSQIHIQARKNFTKRCQSWCSSHLPSQPFLEFSK